MSKQSLRSELRHFARIVCLLLWTCATAASAQFGPPPPVDLNVINFPQETQVWCWAAVAQQIINYTNRNGSPPQCALVAAANRAPFDFCCPGVNPACMVTGDMGKVAFLIQTFGGTPTSYAPPADPMTVYRTLQQGRPIIAQLRTGLINTHVVVIRGMFWQPYFNTLVPMLVINDPLAYFAQPVPFANVAQIWMDALVVL